MTAAVCYVTDRARVFPTLLSAVQASSGAAKPLDVVVVVVMPIEDWELKALRHALTGRNIRLITMDPRLLTGLPVTFGRYFLDEVLPPEISHIVYLDGDTQVLGDVRAIAERPLAVGTVAACLDPMVLLSSCRPRWGRKINRWWDRAGLPSGVRQRYVNSGVFVIRRETLAPLREQVVQISAGIPSSKFLDQDAFNIALDGQVSLMPLTYNFPGFLLGTAAQRVIPTPTVIHFMSSPRPWQGPYAPWGSTYYRPYEWLAQMEPGLSHLWRRIDFPQSLRYRVQQGMKSLVENRSLRTHEVEERLRELEAEPARYLSSSSSTDEPRGGEGRQA